WAVAYGELSSSAGIAVVTVSASVGLVRGPLSAAAAQLLGERVDAAAELLDLLAQGRELLGRGDAETAQPRGHRLVDAVLDELRTGLHAVHGPPDGGARGVQRLPQERQQLLAALLDHVDEQRLGDGAAAPTLHVEEDLAHRHRGDVVTRGPVDDAD